MAAKRLADIGFQVRQLAGEASTGEVGVVQIDFVQIRRRKLSVLQHRVDHISACQVDFELAETVVGSILNLIFISLFGRRDRVRFPRYDIVDASGKIANCDRDRGQHKCGDEKVSQQ